MEFKSEWLLEDPIELLSEISTGLHSTDEIERFSTKENLTEVEKALLFLENGQMNQKLWVVRAIHLYIDDDRFLDVVGQLVMRLPYWNESGQEEAGKAFIQVLEKYQLPQDYEEHLLTLIFEIIDTETLSLQDIWVQVFCELTKQLSKNLISGKWLREIFNLANFSKPDHIRSIAGEMLGFVAERLEHPQNEDLVRKIYSMSQDPINLVRKRMCGAIKAISKAIPSDKFETELIPHLLELFRDEVPEVLDEALKIFCELIDMVSSNSALMKINEILNTALLNCESDKLKEVYLKYYGKIITSLRFHFDETTRLACIDWFVGFSETKSETVKMEAAFNFPAVVLVASGFNDKLFSFFKMLAKEENFDIKKTIAKQLADNVRFCTSRIGEFLEIVRGYLKDASTQYMVIPQLLNIALHTCCCQEFLEVLKRKMMETQNWRNLVMILTEIKDFVTHADYLDYNSFVPLLINYMHSAPYIVKQKSAELLAAILHYNYRAQKKTEIIELIINEFSLSSKFCDRSLFIDFCVYIKDLCSRNFFCKHFLDQLFQLGKDHINNVKCNFAAHYTELRYCIHKDDAESAAKFRNILNFYIEDSDKLLSELAVKADDALNSKSWEEAYGDEGETIDHLRQKFETEQVEKEQKEIGNFKKAMMEEITVRNRQNSQGSRNFRHSTRSGAKTPVKRYSLSDADRYESMAKNVQRSFIATKKHK
ncbi:PPP4R4_1 [Blepharisma stoltei]|uniref:Uncharacterized protein n=1 Tax=Blepharisma stoltei TaxID=1481888 RepID=A0AAU9J0T6_9CILI|nr:unnamed protein product [Blepharisma stoltei]